MKTFGLSLYLIEIGLPQHLLPLHVVQRMVSDAPHGRFQLLLRQVVLAPAIERMERLVKLLLI